MVAPRTRRYLSVLLLGVLLAAFTGFVAVRNLLPPRLAAWVASPGFNHLLSSAVSTALKVEGTFGPMALGPDLSVTTENFTSTGWPGQAIAGLDTGRATGWFEPLGILRSRWQVNLIHIDHANFRLRNPDDALKAQDPVQPPKPWYAFLMPSQFFCGWIDCPSMDIELPLGGTTVQGSNLHVGAKMIGRNFEYFGKNGTLHYAGYPDLAVDAVKVYVTRELIDIGYLYLREPASPRSNLQLSARLGQHADKSIHAEARITRLGLKPFLPEEVAAILDGQLEGQVSYDVDATGEHESGQGSLAVINGRIQNWDYLDNLAARAGRPELRTLDLEQASFDYSLEEDNVQVGNLVIRGSQMVDLSGEGSWNIRTFEATADLSASRIPIGAYLPSSLAGSVQGEIAGRAAWTWRGTDLANGQGGGTLSLTGGRLAGFRFQEFLDRFLKTAAYGHITLTRATADWKQDDKGLCIDNVDVFAPGQVGLRGSAHLAPDGTLSGTVLAGLPEGALQWLPGATTTVFPLHEDGLHWCTIELSGTAERPRTDFPSQVLKQLEKHPVALAELALRGLSWWLGDRLRHQNRGTSPD